MKDQLIKILETEGLSPAKFADEIGVQRSSISHIISGRNKPSYDFISKVLSRFTGINAEWLITGKGQMIKSEIPAKNNAKQQDLFETGGPGSSKITKIKDVPDPIYSLNKTDNQDISDKDKSSNNEISSMVTNVNKLDFVLIFYKDGTYKRYIERD